MATTSPPSTSSPADAAPHAAAEHPSTGTYIKVAVILCVVTALEFAVIYIRALTPILVPLLLVLSAGKFALVVLFYMHLRYESRAVSGIFAGSLTIATGIAVALLTLTGAFLVFGR